MNYPLQHLNSISENFQTTKKMPVLFLGHGSPMNGIEDNEFVQGFIAEGKKLDRPNVIVVVSAHWETKGSRVTAMENPRTIHDFGGFPKALYEVKYPAPGHPALAKEIKEMMAPEYSISLDHQWGLDHGAWTVVKHLFPEADVPVIQLSLDYTLSPYEHYSLGQQLKKLRNKGVLIIGSGNMVHNLSKVAWHRLQSPFGFDWALEANDKMKSWIMSHNHKALINFHEQGPAFDLAIPTAEHYLPLLYTLSLQDAKDPITLFNDQPIGGSLTMTSVRIG